MKYRLSLPICLLALTALSLDNPPGKLVGRWQPKTPPGVSVVTAFRPDNTFDVFVNSKTFVSGQYWFRHDTLAVSDPICGKEYYGLYSIAFMGEDSVRLTPLQDTCTARRNANIRTPTMGRVKPTKP